LAAKGFCKYGNLLNFFYDKVGRFYSNLVSKTVLLLKNCQALGAQLLTHIGPQSMGFLAQNLQPLTVKCWLRV